ncbi:hypothetical protein D9615_003101 [Tricholomella constricta]|uniref:Protein kinase domain-containing protein n=1 Tax=Tricholomella constricta TaxID=117010 RepID=A0A8H5HJ18_9AGAR|nr:hypothetical protein D9615_003101 [Tricholomella constricta]
MPASTEEIEKAFQEACVGNPFLTRDHFMGKHIGSEHFWVGIQPFLLARGYRLRPRYNPGWIATWLKEEKVNKDISLFEDCLNLHRGKNVPDAVRISDGLRVVLKRVETRSNEISIAQYLALPHLRSDPRNHTVPIVDILLLPNEDEHAIVVMPQLLHFNQLPFRRLGELTDALRQFFEGLDFLHDHNITHRDACYYNLTMDGSKVVPRGLHFMADKTHDGVTRKIEWNDRSSVGPIQYYLIDFGLSERFPVRPTEFYIVGQHGQDRSVPEHKREGTYDPFKVDIYQLGNVVMRLIEIYEGLEPLLGIATALTRKNPDERLPLREAIDQLGRIPKRVLKRRVWQRTCPPDVRISIRFCGGSTETTW